MSAHEQIFLIKQLSYLTGAGVPLLESVVILKGQEVKRNMISFLDAAEHDIRHGHTLSKCVSRYQTFTPIIPAFIHIGEQSGTLPQSLASLAEELRKKYVLRKKIIGALIYPAIVTGATFSIIGALILLVFPKIIPVFKSMHIPLPLTTRIVLSICTFIQNYWFFILIGSILLSIGVYVLYIRIPRMRQLSEWLLLHTPVLGGLIHRYTMSNLYRTLSILLKNGMTITDGILVTRNTTEHAKYQRACENLYVHMLTGKQLSYGMNERKDVFSPTAIHIIATGEKTGNLTQALSYISEMYEIEVDDLTKNLSNAIEPILMIIMGLLVGFIALSIVTPIYEITQQLRAR